MKKETKQLYRDLAYYSSLGFSIALSIFIGLLLGLFLDKRFFPGSHWCTFICLGLGIAAGFRNIYLTMKKSQKYHEK
ncbi:ATP synthase protein I [Candidatus Magnetomoraceae bacterium gMMP-15]